MAKARKASSTSRSSSSNPYAKPNYRNWLQSQEGRQNVINLLEKEGYPVEVRTKELLRKQGYHASNSFYTQRDEKRDAEITREIDIVANKRFQGFNVHGCQVDFVLHIIGDCKKSSYYDFFAFPRDKLSLSYEFPLIYNAKNEVFGRGIGIEKLFEFPIVIQNLAKVNTSGKPSKDSDDDSQIYDGCEQIISAFQYFRKYQLLEIIKTYSKIYHDNRIRNLFDAYNAKKSPVGEKKGGLFVYGKQVMGDFLRDPQTLAGVYSVVHQIDIHIGVPSLILDENNALLDVKMKNGKIRTIAEVGYGLYLYPPSRASQFEGLVGYSGYFPVVLCNERFLKKCIKSIEEGMTEMINHANSMLKQNPAALYWDIYSAVNDTIASSV